MNIEKIEINGHYVWVDKDAEIKEDCYALHLGVLGEREIVMANGECKLDKKIISASPELNLEGVPTYVEWLAEQETNRNEWNSEKSFIRGYQTAEKELPTWDDVIRVFHVGRLYQGREGDTTLEEIIEQLKQSKQ